MGRMAAPDHYRCSIAVAGVYQKKMSLQVALVRIVSISFDVVHLENVLGRHDGV
jgi:hypothetical protein